MPRGNLVKVTADALGLRTATRTATFSLRLLFIKLIDARATYNTHPDTHTDAYRVGAGAQETGPVAHTRWPANRPEAPPRTTTLWPATCARPQIRRNTALLATMSATRLYVLCFAFLSAYAP